MKRLCMLPRIVLCRCLALSLCVLPSLAPAQTPVSAPCTAGQQAADTQATDTQPRRRPGVEPPTAAEPVVCNPGRMPAPPDEPLPTPSAVPDRWRLVEQLGRPVTFGNPYAASNPLKGDRPTFGADGFTNLSVTSNTLLEPRLIPSTSPLQSGTVPGVTRTLTRDETFLSQTVSFDAAVYRGDTVFRPPDWQWRFNPAINYSFTRAGGADASGGVFAIQGLSFEKHLRDVSSRYDFDSVRVGIQPLTSDFRGFLLSDQPLAMRLFGTRDDNIFQYNLALISRVPKDRVRLNDVGRGIPNNQIALGNLYWQDFPVSGVTSEFILALNRNRAAGPRQLFTADGAAAGPAVKAPHDYDVAYLGYGLDGHFGRLNATAVVYGLGGREQRGTFVDESTQVRSLFAADELSVDFDWRRIRLSMLHASGDGNPFDRRAQGFDTLTSGAIFAGSDSSFFFHERLALAGGTFDLKSRDGLLPSLRAAGNSGDSNFTNPGLDLLGLGLDLALTPQLTVSLDANQLWFDKTGVLAALLNQPAIPRRLGAEATLDAIWRPFATQNVIFRLSASQMARGPGYRALYGGSNPFSAFALLILNY
ncbi:MAG TPA: hypothetical protein VN325_07340 [Steroidobacteraceae bacterium]|nr:hypothetical protein [Steroidobacteraceae bacterium]